MRVPTNVQWLYVSLCVSLTGSVRWLLNIASYMSLVVMHSAPHRKAITTVQDTTETWEGKRAIFLSLACIIDFPAPASADLMHDSLQDESRRGRGMKEYHLFASVDLARNKEKKVWKNQGVP